MKWCSVFPSAMSPHHWTKNGYRYRHIYEPGNEYPIYQRQSVLSAEWDEWDILLDANQRAAHSEFYTLGGMSVSPDNAIMALAEDYLSRRQYGLRFRNLETGNWYPEMIANVSPDFVWANDSETVYYVKKHASTLLPYQVWRHTVGTSADDDELVYEEKDETFYVSLHKTSSRHYVIIFLASATTSEVLLWMPSCLMRSRSASCRVVKIMSTAWITSSTAFTCALTARAKTLAYIKPKYAMNGNGKCSFLRGNR